MFYRINKRKNAKSSRRLALVILSVFLFTLGAAAQSTSVDFPTPVTGNEISGTVAARDVGDARLTTHYYLLAGNQGDLFINVVTNNFNGGIDLFVANSLDPVAKIAVYANLGRTETGRAVYLRKAAKLVLRIQGRTPNDAPAEYTIKFAGSFVALRDSDAPRPPELPRVTAGSETAVKVNAVGTILEQPVSLSGEAKEKTEIAKTRADADGQPAEKPAPEKAATKTATSPKQSNRKTADNLKPTGAPVAKVDSPPSRAPVAKADSPTTATRPRTANTNKSVERAAAKKPASSAPAAATETNSAARRPARTPRPAPRTPAPSPPDPMANFRLIVLFKDGKKIERPMTEVLRFGVDKGVLTIVHKDGTTGKYSMITVAKVSVE